MDEKIMRLIEGFKIIGKWGDRGLYADIARQTGFTPSYVSQVFSGKKVPAGKFIIAVSKAFAINEYWIETGNHPRGTVLGGYEGGGVFDPDAPIAVPPHFGIIAPRPQISGHITDEAVVDVILKNLEVHFPGIRKSFWDPAAREGLKELWKMPESKRYRAVAMLKEMNENAPDQEG